ncbi:MAG TPA: AbgT family transporter, partial [Lentimicrobium sp.]|nr:AbgT family transporter [Lentimicrobium sp.]
MKQFFKKALNRFITIVEKGGNALPHPAALFGIFAIITLVVSAIGHWLGWQGANPATGETISV